MNVGLNDFRCAGTSALPIFSHRLDTQADLWTATRKITGNSGMLAGSSWNEVLESKTAKSTSSKACAYAPK